jgi:hypothetical protein
VPGSAALSRDRRTATSIVSPSLADAADAAASRSDSRRKGAWNEMT